MALMKTEKRFSEKWGWKYELYPYKENLMCGRIFT